MDTISYVALFTGIASIILAAVAIWLAIAFKKQSDDINRDTTEKLARIEAFATSTKEDAFAEIKRWGDFARAGGKSSEEVEKAKEEQMNKLKDEIKTTTSIEINKVLQYVEKKLASLKEPSAFSEIKTQFDQLKKEIAKIQDKGLVEVKKLESEDKIRNYWLSLPVEHKFLLEKVVEKGKINYDDLNQIGPFSNISLHKLFSTFMREGFISRIEFKKPGSYELRPTQSFIKFLKSIRKDEMD